MLVLYGVAIMTAKKSMREVVKNVERIRSAVKAKVDSICPRIREINFVPGLELRSIGRPPRSKPIRRLAAGAAQQCMY